MNKPKNWLIHDHHKYDAELYNCELAADAGDWDNAKHLFDIFVADIKLHMQMEDEVLYPLFVEKNGDTGGVIAHLGEEHDHIANLVKNLASIIKDNDHEHFLSILELLHEALNTHNKREENVYKIMVDQSIFLRREEIMERIKTANRSGGRVWDF